MQQAPSEVFHYADTRGHSDAILLSKSCTILNAAKKDLLGLIQLQVRPGDRTPPSAEKLSLVKEPLLTRPHNCK